MNATECIKKLSPVLFWDVDKSQADMDKYPSFFVQRVLVSTQLLPRHFA